MVLGKEKSKYKDPEAGDFMGHTEKQLFLTTVSKMQIAM